MIGNGLVRGLAATHQIAFTTRRTEVISILSDVKVFCNVDALDQEQLTLIIREFRAEVVINAVGVVKQKILSGDEVTVLELNSVLPYRLLNLAEAFDFKLILLSTDCVFSGQRGNYTENDIPDALDLYGRSKILGEVVGRKRALTLRISTIGLELKSQKGLVEWFLHQTGSVKGYTKAIYTGFTSLELSRIISLILTKHPSLSGLFHVSAEPISKYDLLSMLKELVRKDDVQIIPDGNFFCDRSLNSDRFRHITGYQPPAWDVMLTELAKEIKGRQSQIK